MDGVTAARRGGVLAILLLLPFGVAACTPKVAGLTGVAVNADGHLVIDLAGCGAHSPAQAIVYHSVTDLDARILTDVEFDVVSQYDGAATIDTDAPDGWRLAQGTLTLDPALTYGAFGLSGTSSTRKVTFTAADLGGLHPGQVRYADDRGRALVVDRAEFTRAAGTAC